MAKLSTECQPNLSRQLRSIRHTRTYSRQPSPNFSHECLDAVKSPWPPTATVRPDAILGLHLTKDNQYTIKRWDHGFSRPQYCLFGKIPIWNLEPVYRTTPPRDRRDISHRTQRRPASSSAWQHPIPPCWRQLKQMMPSPPPSMSASDQETTQKPVGSLPVF